MQSITYLTIDLTIDFELDGKYYPATRETPEEHPELIIKGVYADSVDIMPLLLDVQIEDITDLLMEKGYE